MQKGTIGVTTENIFPVIKKFLYSDHEIFLRELVSNAVDATQKLKTLSSCGEFKGELGDLSVTVTVNKEAGTLTVSDHGIGMTSDDIDKYINQIAFSGAEEFLSKYKDSANAIIGHFGLGFYSAFMVAKKVEIHSLSHKEGAKAVLWQCDGSPEYSMSETDKDERGTDIVLYIDDENKDFLEQIRIDTLLKKYCRFLPVSVKSNDKVINDTEPQWTKKPSELTDDDYRKFYHELYPGQDDPLFWIHLNVDFPFTLTGILFFPKIHNNFEITKNRIQLYCNQVFVTDSVEGVVPEFMMLMQGVIDSPDIPLNVSRSYLQSDAAVKKISGYITKKVSARLDEIFRNSRSEFEEKWDDIKIFIEYGMLSDEKFCESAMKFALLKDTEGKHFTFDEYKTLVEASQTDKDGNIIYLYATDKQAQFSYIKAAIDKGYNVLMMDGQLDSHFIGLLEQKFEKTRIVRVDSDVIENLIVKENKKEANLTAAQRAILTTAFSSQTPTVDKAQFLVTFEALSSDDMPIIITQNEFMRRMKDMAAMQAGMNFYSEMPDSYNLVVNTENSLINKVCTEATSKLEATVNPLLAKVDADNAELSKLRAVEKKDAETEQKIKDLEKEVADTRAEQEIAIKNYAKDNDLIKQLIDLALLSNGLLRGEALNAFVSRSVSLLKD
jgi:molecular chaperone HtpG